MSNGLLELCHDAATGNHPWLNKRDHRHEEFMKYLRSPTAALLEYRPSHQRLFCNGELVTRSTPAKILAKMLAERSRTGRDTFTNWDLINDPDITFDPVFHNVPVRIRRVIETVEAKCDCIRVQKSGRGKIRLEGLQPFEYHEL